MSWQKLFRPKESIPPYLYLSLGLGSFVILLGLWSFVTYSGLIPPFYLPSPTQVIQSALDMAREGGLLDDTLASVSRVTLGFLVSAAVGIPLGILMGSLKIGEAFFEPIMGFFRYMPASAFIPLLIIWVGIEETEKIAVIILGTFFQLTLMVMDVTKNVSSDLIDISYTLGARSKDVFLRVILPASWPGILDTLRLSFGWAWTYLVVAEIVGARSGLGYMIMQSQRFLKTANVMAGIIVIGLIGIVIDLTFRSVYRRLFPWMAKGGV